MYKSLCTCCAILALLSTSFGSLMITTKLLVTNSTEIFCFRASPLPSELCKRTRS